MSNKSYQKQTSSTNKKVKIFYLYAGFFLFTCFVLLDIFHIQEKKAINNFFKTYNISKSEMTYKNASLSLFGEGLIFYHVNFPDLSSQHIIDKMLVKKEDNTLRIKVVGANLDILNSIRRVYSIRIIDTLKSYSVIDDALTKPLQTLSLCDIDKVKMNINLDLEFGKNETFLKAQFNAPKLFSINLSGLLQTQSDAELGLVHAFNGSLKPYFLSLEDKGIFKLYDNYLNSLDIPEDSPKRQLLQENVIELKEKDLSTINLLPLFKK